MRVCSQIGIYLLVASFSCIVWHSAAENMSNENSRKLWAIVPVIAAFADKVVATVVKHDRIRRSGSQGGVDCP